MINNDFQQIIDDFDFFDDWEDKYRYVIEEGKKMPVLDESLKVDSNKVNGCASQVWLNCIVFTFEPSTASPIFPLQRSKANLPNTSNRHP